MYTLPQHVKCTERYKTPSLAPGLLLQSERSMTSNPPNKSEPGVFHTPLIFPKATPLSIIS